MTLSVISATWFSERHNALGDDEIRPSPVTATQKELCGPPERSQILKARQTLFSGCWEYRKGICRLTYWIPNSEHSRLNVYECLLHMKWVYVLCCVAWMSVFFYIYTYNEWIMLEHGVYYESVLKGQLFDWSPLLNGFTPQWHSPMNVSRHYAVLTSHGCIVVM